MRTSSASAHHSEAANKPRCCRWAMPSRNISGAFLIFTPKEFRRVRSFCVARTGVPSHGVMPGVESVTRWDRTGDNAYGTYLEMLGILWTKSGRFGSSGCFRPGTCSARRPKGSNRPRRGQRHSLALYQREWEWSSCPCPIRSSARLPSTKDMLSFLAWEALLTNPRKNPFVALILGWCIGPITCTQTPR